MKLRLYRIGSDPECLFARVKDWKAYIVPANTIITNNRNLGLTTFIGTDGHPATCEFRPRPAHNVGGHMYDLAVAVTTTADHLAQRKGFEDVALLASPWVENEPLGGHIHLSFFLDDPLIKAAQDVNLIYHNGQFVAYNTQMPAVTLTESIRVKLGAYAANAAEGKAFTPLSFAKALDHLLVPFECWVQPWHGRIRRNGRYGINNDVVRMMNHTRPPDLFPNLAYFHTEYRMPSTWLQHPTVTYCYLALAKLAVLNFSRLKEIHGGKNISIRLYEIDKPNTDLAFKLFHDTLNALFKGRAIITNDLKRLPAYLDTLAKHRQEWLDPLRPVNVAAWREIQL